MKPWEFWALLPREFDLMVEGFHRREDRALHLTALLGTWVLAPHRGKNKQPVTVKALVGRMLQLFPVVRRE